MYAWRIKYLNHYFEKHYGNKKPMEYEEVFITEKQSVSELGALFTSIVETQTQYDGEITLIKSLGKVNSDQSFKFRNV